MSDSWKVNLSNICSTTKITSFKKGENQMKLSADVVTKLALLKADIATKQKEEKELVAELKAAMEAEELQEYAPKHSPYKLIFNSYERSSVSWKDEWKTLAKKMFGSQWKIKETELTENSKTEIKSLNVEPNERYVA
jgi:hypothetical protein